MVFDAEMFLKTPMFAIDQLGILASVSEFLAFSEESIVKQKQAELAEVDEKVAHASIDEAEVVSYKEHLLDSINFKFDVALPMRIRYATLTALTSTIEWSMAVLRPSFSIGAPPRGTAQVVHRLTVFSQRCGISLSDKIRQLEFLLWVRNSIMHNAGVLKGYRFEAEIRRHIAAYGPNFMISDWHYIGETVEIRRGTLEPIILSWGETIRDLCTKATEQKLLLFSEI